MDYKAIDCGWYDHFELASIRQETVKLELQNGVILYGQIEDLFSKKGEGEFALVSGSTIRLDRIIKLNGQDVTGVCER